jgi:hypothetical protein
VCEVCEGESKKGKKKNDEIESSTCRAAIGCSTTELILHLLHVITHNPADYEHAAATHSVNASTPPKTRLRSSTSTAPKRVWLTLLLISGSLTCSLASWAELTGVRMASPVRPPRRALVPFLACRAQLSSHEQSPIACAVTGFVG